MNMYEISGGEKESTIQMEQSLIMFGIWIEHSKCRYENDFYHTWSDKECRLSDQLYEKETHFLLELIWNADDNTFHVATPSLSFTCKLEKNRWTLEIECNEVGFRPENVEALCRIGDSTKKVDARTQGFIGEKGVGFKSVFKVANVVRIHSKAYFFMLDRMARLGLIAPIVDRSPWQASRDERSETCMLLELNRGATFRAIMDELLRLEPGLLIFLRKISKCMSQRPTKNSNSRFGEICTIVRWKETRLLLW